MKHNKWEKEKKEKEKRGGGAEVYHKKTGFLQPASFYFSNVFLAEEQDVFLFWEGSNIQ